MQPIIENSYLVETNLGTVATGKTINFLYIPELDGVTVYGVQVYTASDIAVSPNGNAVVTTAGAANIVATFLVGDNERITKVPVLDLRSATNAGFIRMFSNLKINLTKSLIQIVDVTGLSNNQSLLFNFIYRR